ncbi:hypothetical protein FOL47_006430 [Perkinsus chesapeaki]|uniref:Sulfite exporter TauE/SafE n=1 Tax=Perkinsus chesapeaki TaxID=330153 RepID=A0A7J6MXZ2_PERCH|nr:hypothetical protein FOL47_006430 [Perkinsus chesapeaki]
MDPPLHVENIGVVAPVIFIIAMLCMPPGVGGGILFVPLLNLVGKLPSKNATAMSQTLVASAVCAKILFSLHAQFTSRHKSRVIILPFVVLMLPSMIVGGLIGVYIYSWLPVLIQLILYVVTALFGSTLSLLKGRKLWRAESQAIAAAKREAAVAKRATEQPTGADNNDDDAAALETHASESPSAPRVSPLLRPITRMKAALCLAAVVGVWIVVILSRLILGSASTDSIVGIPFCQGLYWGLSALVVVVLMAVPVIFALVDRSRETSKAAVTLSGSLLGIGFLASVVGISGGIIITPLIMFMGLTPPQASGTGSLVILVSSSSLALSFGLGGFLPAASDLWIIVLPFCGALAPLIPRQSILFIVALCIIWLVVVVSRLLLGSAGTPSLIGIPYCESLYWALSVVVIAVLLAVPGIYIIVNKSPGVFNISIKLSAALLCIGFIAAMVGQGGGTLITPLLLHMELDPAQASATGSVVMLVTSSSLALSFGLGGFLPAASDMWIIVLPFFGALIGDLLLSKLMKWAGRLSLLALSLAVLATTGAMVIFVTGIVQVLSASQHQGGGTSPFTLGSIC